MDFRNSVESVRRKLRALSAVAQDSGATEHERANAAALRARLKQRLKDAGAPAWDWSDHAFRLGRWAKTLRSSASAEGPKGDWTNEAFRLGRALRRGYKKWSS
jgi:hypothetical protein